MMYFMRSWRNAGKTNTSIDLVNERVYRFSEFATRFLNRKLHNTTPKMKKLVFILGCTLIIMSCNNSGDTGQPEAKTPADTLLDEVMSGHDLGMAKMGKLIRAQKEITRLIDSVQKLPAKAREAASPYKAGLDSLLAELNHADYLMNKWMEEFNMDSAIDKTEERIRYLSSEKLKVTEMKDAILNSLQKTDSLLRRKI